MASFYSSLHASRSKGRGNYVLGPVFQVIIENYLGISDPGSLEESVLFCSIAGNMSSLVMNTAIGAAARGADRRHIDQYS
jgi:hypothetical protein